jgi:hypothetical protein
VTKGRPLPGNFARFARAFRLGVASTAGGSTLAFPLSLVPRAQTLTFPSHLTGATRARPATLRLVRVPIWLHLATGVAFPSLAPSGPWAVHVAEVEMEEEDLETAFLDAAEQIFDAVERN